MSRTEIEFGFVDKTWTEIENLDGGTHKVVSDGYKILYDHYLILKKLVEKVMIPQQIVTESAACNMENLKQARVNLMISDMDQAIDFYVDILGLELVNRYANHYAELDANGFMIALHPTNGNVMIGNNISIGLGVFNFDKTIEALEVKGIQFNFEKGGYIRLAHFSDPFGNCLFLAENK